MRILIAGLPGSGKSTQVERLSKDLGLPTISMGGILREIAASGSELGLRVQEIMRSGELVDDKTVAELIKQKVESDDATSGFVMEGYPRTLEQVELFDPKFDRVFYLEVPEETAKKRMTGRGRHDDSDEAISVRIKVQMEDMEKILNYYEDALHKVDGTKPIDEVYQEIKKDL